MSNRSGLFFLLHRLLGSDLDQKYAEFMSIRDWHSRRLNELVNSRLGATLKHAASVIPHYQKHVSNRRDLTLDQFPILTKNDLNEHYSELMLPDLHIEYADKKRKQRYSWIEMKTGGSTGTPTRVIHDRSFREYGRAAKLYCNAMCGFPLGTPYLMLWGSMNDIRRMQSSWGTRALNWFLNFDLMNAFRMDNSRIEEYIARINASKSEHMMAYVDALYQLALYSQEHNKPVRPLRSIMGCAGTITSEMRTCIESVFGCKLHNKYGSRDCGDMACECSNGGFHIFTNYVYLEVVDDRGYIVPPGVSGRILVTTLTNKSFPLIRYEIGDIGAISSSTCTCGSPLPLLERIEGRTYEMILDTSGGVVTPVYIRHLIGVVHNSGEIKRFQFLQSAKKDYQLVLEMESEPPSDMLKGITHDLQSVLGVDAQIAINHTQHIEETESGKFLYTRNEYLNLKTA